MSSQHHHIYTPAATSASSSSTASSTRSMHSLLIHKASHSVSSTASHTAIGHIDLSALLATELASLALSPDYADVHFLVDGQRLPAHRTILAARSDYFRALLFGGMAESTQPEIRLDGIPLQAFRTLLRYIYSGHMDLSALSVDQILDTFGLAHQYGFDALQAAISAYLRDMLCIDNVCAILDAASLYDLPDLCAACLTFMDGHAVELLQHASFGQLTRPALAELLRRDSFYAPEVQIFQAVHRWSRANPDEPVDGIVSLVRLSLMDTVQLLKVVRPSGILPADRLLDVFEERATASALRHRGALWPGENVASQKFGSQVVSGEYRQALLDDNCVKYDMEKGYTRHTIGDGEAEQAGIVVELGTISIVNHLRLLLWDRDSRSYGYYVEVSVDQQQWDRVIDHSEYMCRSWQWLWFEARAVKYVRLVGTHNTENKIFHAVSLQAMYADAMPPLRNGFVVPRQNVALVDRSATVVRGVGRSRNALINGDCAAYDLEMGYTCHQLGCGEILVQLGQPYWLGSLRLLLWDCDDRSYSFYVETSADMRDWDMAVDWRQMMLKSWQSCRFRARLVVFVKIVGTFNTANDIFHCVHFECPSQVESEPDDDALCMAGKTPETLSESADAEEPTQSDVDDVRLQPQMDDAMAGEVSNSSSGSRI